MNGLGRVDVGTAMVLLAIMLTGCIVSGTQYGTIRPSKDVEQIFKSMKIVPNCKYYYTGPDSSPDAIVGLRNEYTLKSRYWTPVDITPAQIGSWVEGIDEYRGLAMSMYGANILAPNGDHLGVWYSPFDLARVEMLGDNVITIHQPMNLSPVFFGRGESSRDD